MTIDRMEGFIKGLNDKVKEKGWGLTQGRYDAIFDMYWNAGSGKGIDSEKVHKYKIQQVTIND